MTRKVKDIIDNTTHEAIYPVAHAQATYLSDGTTVEDAINDVKNITENVDGKKCVNADGITTDQFTYALPYDAWGGEDFILATKDDAVKILNNYNNASISLGLSPNIYYRLDTAMTNLTILGFVEPTDTQRLNEYFIEFKVASGGTVTFPSYIKWADGEIPTFESGYVYQVSITHRDGDNSYPYLGTCIKFK